MCIPVPVLCIPITKCTTNLIQPVREQPRTYDPRGWQKDSLCAEDHKKSIAQKFTQNLPRNPNKQTLESKFGHPVIN